MSMFLFTPISKTQLIIIIVLGVLAILLLSLKLVMGSGPIPTNAPTRILSSEHTRQMDQVGNLGKFLEVRLNDLTTLEQQTQMALVKAVNNLAMKINSSCNSTR